MNHNNQIYELKIHELKFLVKKLEIHRSIHTDAASRFSKYFVNFIDTIDDKTTKHQLKKIAGLIGENEKPMTKTGKKAKQQAQYRKGKTKVQPEQDEVSIETVEVPKKEVPKEYKALYRKLASATHPDKLKDSDDTKVEMFKKINNAVANEDYFKLVEYAMILDVDIPEDVSIDIEHIDQKIISINKEIQDLTKTVAWEWYHMNEEQKQVLIQKYANYLLEQ
tara:strand:- start:154 stop:819 length:666 start_codon:yes stop_codon:yes gene_type:complete